MATSRLLHHPSSIIHPIPSHATNPTKKRPTEFTCNVITHARNNSWMGWVKEGLSDRRKMLFLPPFFFSLPFFWHAKQINYIFIYIHLHLHLYMHIKTGAIRMGNLIFTPFPQSPSPPLLLQHPTPLPTYPRYCVSNLPINRQTGRR